MEQETGLTYEVPGADIIARMEERATMADAVVEDLSGHDSQNACNAGLIRQAAEDAKALRLSAKYLVAGKTYTLNPGTLQTVFLTEPHYANEMARGLGGQVPESTSRSW